MCIVLFSNELQFHGLLLTVEKMLKSWMIWRRCGGDCGRDWDWGHNEIQYLECLGWLFGFNFMFPYLFSMYMLNRDRICKGKITNWIKSLIQFPYSHRLHGIRAQVTLKTLASHGRQPWVYPVGNSGGRIRDNPLHRFDWRVWKFLNLSYRRKAEWKELLRMDPIHQAGYLRQRQTWLPYRRDQTATTFQGSSGLPEMAFWEFPHHLLFDQLHATSNR